MNATVGVAQISNADPGAERNEDELRALAGESSMVTGSRGSNGQDEKQTVRP